MKLSPRKIHNWLRRENSRFGGATPFETICRGSVSAKRVAYEIEEMEVGAGELVKNIMTKYQRGKDKGLGDVKRLADLDNRLANVIARGIPARQKLVEAEGGSFSAAEAAHELGISKTAILKRYQKGQLIAWRQKRQNAVRFPVWQFQDGRVLDGIEPALKVLNAGSRLDDFGRMLFFLSNSRFLGGQRPLDCLRRARVSKVLQAAEGYGGQP